MLRLRLTRCSRYVAFAALTSLCLLNLSPSVHERQAANSQHVIFLHYAAPELHFGSDIRLLEVMRLTQQAGHQVSFLSRSRGPAVNRRALQNVVSTRTYAVGSRWLTRWHPLIRACKLSSARATFIIPIWFWEGSLPTVFEEYVPVLRKLLPFAKIVAMSDDCHSRRELLLAQVLRSDERPEFYASSMPSPSWFAEKEHSIYSAADVVTFVSELDAQSCASLISPTVPRLLLRTGPRLDVVQHAPDRSQRDGLLFLGNGPNPTNAYAIRQFLNEVWPLFCKEEPGMKLYLVGQDSKEAAPCKEHGMLCGWTWRTPFYGSEERNNIIITNFVPSLQTIVKRRLAMVVPISVSTGVNTKLFEAFHNGLPVISTSLPLSALELEGGSCCILCEVNNATCWLQAARMLLNPSTWADASAASMRTGHELFVAANERHDILRLFDLLRSLDTPVT